MPTWLNAAAAGAARRSNERAKKMREERRGEKGSNSEWTTSTSEIDPEQAKSLQTFSFGLYLVIAIMIIFIIISYVIDRRKMNKYDTKYSEDDDYEDDFDSWSVWRDHWR